MNRSRPRDRMGLRIHLVVVAAFALVFALWRATAGDPVTDAIEDRLLDLRFQVRGPITAPRTVVVVAIDERTVDSLGWSLPPRGAIAEAVGRIVEAGPTALAVDLLLLEQTAAGPTLAAALAQFDRVVMAAAVTRSTGEAPAALPPELQVALDRSGIAIVVDAPPPGMLGVPPRLLLPRPEIVGGATLGHVNIALSADRVARRLPLGIWVGGSVFLPAMSLEAARISAELERGRIVLSPGHFLRFGDRHIEIDPTGSVTLNPYGGRAAIATVSLVDILEGRVPATAFKNRAVFIGATAEILGDLFATPYSAAVPGVEILATLTANLIEGDLIVRDVTVRALDVVLALLLAWLVHLALRLRAPPAAFAAVGAVWLMAAMGLHLAFTQSRFWLDATTILATLVFATAWMAAQRLRAEGRLAATLSEERGNLARYVSPFLAEQLARGSVAVFDQRTQDAAVLFVDVVGYTTFSEAKPPARIAAFLRDLHHLFEHCASSHRGVITAFMGDGAMIVFGLPAPGPDDAAAALACAKMLLGEAERFTSAAIPGQRLGVRVSMHFGPVTAAILGGRRHAQVTVTGDTVNVSSRLQEIAKRQGSPLVVSRAGLDAARAAGSSIVAEFVPLPDQSVRGRKGRIEVWALAPRHGNTG
jgi:adenylate cyclase